MAYHMASSELISVPPPNTHTEKEWKNTTLTLKSPHWKPCYPVCRCQSSPVEGCQYGKAQWRRGTMNTLIICTHVWAINCVIRKSPVDSPGSQTMPMARWQESETHRMNLTVFMQIPDMQLSSTQISHISYKNTYFSTQIYVWLPAFHPST